MAGMKGSAAYAESLESQFDPKNVSIAVVMDNRDPTKNGKLKVWIKGSQSLKESKDSWITCKYLSIFAGKSGGVQGAGNYEQFPKSYGFWAVPPDVGAEVAVFFVNGDIHNGFWFGCVIDENMNSMIPSPAMQIVEDSGYDMPMPVTNYDRNTVGSDTQDLYVNSPLVDGLSRQNLLYDEQKGLANRNSSRAIISSVYGINSPRGQCIIMDDGYTEEDLTAPSWDDDPESYPDSQYNNPINDTAIGTRQHEGIVLRTRSGAQFILSESDGFVFIINRDGTARIELTDDGDVVVHASKSISYRADEDINIQAGKNLNIDVGENLNVRVGGNSSLELSSNADFSIGSQLVVNAGGELRLVSGGGTKVEANSVDIKSASNIASSASGTNNVTGSSVNLAGGGTEVSLSNDVSSNAIIRAADFQTPQAGFNSHTHVHAQWSGADNHSNEMKPPSTGGSTGTPQKAQQASSAKDIAPQKPQTNETEVVQYTSTTPEVQQTLTQDLLQEGRKMNSYESAGMLMPCTGTIREYGYWGKNVASESADSEDRPGWTIQSKSGVVAPEAGTVRMYSEDIIAVIHKNGYQSVFYDIVASAQDGMIVDKGQSIGSSSGVMKFEIRTSTAPITGFTGSIDPGMFYTSITGVGESAGRKALMVGQPSVKPTPQSGTPSEDSSDLVQISKVNSIGSVVPQRGSKKVPQKRDKKQNTNTSVVQTFPTDYSNMDKTPRDWMVTNSDEMLLNDLKYMEGDIAYQTKVGYFRNGKFYTYTDILGYLTIGYGHVVVSGENFSNGLTPEEAEQLLIKDIAWCVKEAKSIYAMYNMKTPYLAQQVLCQMVFGMGKKGTLGFKKCLTYMSEGKYRKAGLELKDSLVYKQIPNRVNIWINRLNSCE